LRKASRVTKPEAGHLAKAGVEAGEIMREFRVPAEVAAEYKAGSQVPATLFAVGQKVDAAVASTERAAADVKNDVQAATAQVKDSGSAAAAAVAATASDINITAKVNAELAKDPALSALSINVDTTAGRVALIGKAPNEAARKRATGLAAGVEGVVSVDNRLQVETNKS